MFGYKPVTINEWADLEQVFLDVPACKTCWCMYWRKTRREWWGHSTENRNALCMIISDGKVPGILAYLEDQPVGWCSVAPRNEFPGLERSPTLKHIDDRPAWSITCFAVAGGYRRQGITAFLARSAIAYAASCGAKLIEAYPLITPEKRFRLPGETFMGLESTFTDLGFKPVSNRSAVRNIMRLYIV